MSLFGGLSASHDRWERQLLKNSDSPMETSGYERDHIRNAAHKAIAIQVKVLELLPQWGSDTGMPSAVHIDHVLRDRICCLQFLTFPLEIFRTARSLRVLKVSFMAHFRLGF